MTLCGHNFGFDKTESFKASVVMVEVAGAPCKLARQDINRCVWVCLFVCSRERTWHLHLDPIPVCALWRVVDAPAIACQRARQTGVLTFLQRAPFPDGI